jgi:hypothetical protein
LGDKFNPADYLRTITRRKKIRDAKGNEQWVEENHQYLDVKYRLLWFRQVYPDGYIETNEIEVNDKFARIEAIVYDKDPANGGKRLGKGRRQVCAADFKDFCEKAETQAIGRSLAVAGFGTQFCDDLDEEDSVADSPTEKSGAKPNNNSLAEDIPANLSDLYKAASRKGLKKEDTNLLVFIKYQKEDASQLTDNEVQELISGIKDTPRDRLKSFLIRYKASKKQDSVA